ncbi:sodium:solute symporter family protein [Candidatus Cardinium hertigii]|uniref:sodium:solute symporter family protein n=1 Tax=Candidatus Cardinium hertigii TaxID=247481 RepID=UPI003D7ED5A0
MPLYNIPLFMALAFLFVTLTIGLCMSQKSTTFRAYAIGTKQFHTATLIATVLATSFGGGFFMRELPKMYAQGILYIFFTVAGGIVRCYIISLLALHMGPFMEHLSTSETIGMIYGQYIRMVTALLTTGCCIGVVAIQINVMSCAIGMCMDTTTPSILTVLATLTLISYAVFGGIRAITITDLFQLATFTIVLPFLLKLLFVKIDQSFLEMIKFLQKEETFQCKNLFKFDKKYWIHLFNHLHWVLSFSPAVIQRFYMSSGPIQAKKVFSRAVLFTAIIWIGIALIALFVFVGNPMLHRKEIWSYILADMSPFYKGYVAISILAMTMSTADSHLQTASIMISHDMVESMRNLQAPPYMHKLRLAKLATLVTGLLAMIVTVYYSDLFALSTFVFEWLCGFFTAIVIPLFILTVLGFRGTTRTAFMGMTTGMVVILIWNHWIKPKIAIDGTIIAVAANGLATMAAHYLLPQPPSTGWAEPDAQQKRMMELIRAFKKYRKNIDLE